MLKIYLCAFLKSHYVEEAKVCIKSIRGNGKFEGPIYLLTDQDVEIEGVSVIKTSCDSVYLSASYRLRIFEHFPNYSENDIYMYLDTDIVVLKPLPDFNYIDNKIQVYGYPARTQKEISFSGYITDDVYYTSKVAVCSGILLFRPSTSVKEVFDFAYSMYIRLISEGKINGCWEQPALCYSMIKHDMVNISLNKFVYEERTRKPIRNDNVFNHFCGLRGEQRYRAMSKYC